MKSILDEILSLGVVSICRKIYGEELLRLSDALSKGGVRLIEVTFDQADSECIEKTSAAINLIKNAHPEMHVGAGTVLSCEQVEVVKNAGGEFIISPNVNSDVIKFTKSLDLVSVPGAMTPSEILSAWDLGADIVKLFPAGYLGLSYLKDIRAPISHVPLMATGGITVDNFRDYLIGGCCGAGIGSYLSDKKLIAANDWNEFTRRAQTLTAIFKEVKG